MSETPRTDYQDFSIRWEFSDGYKEMRDWARQLERELAAAKAERVKVAEKCAEICDAAAIKINNEYYWTCSKDCATAIRAYAKALAEEK